MGHVGWLGLFVGLFGSRLAMAAGPLTVLQTEQVDIRCALDGEDALCHAQATLDVNPDVVRGLLADSSRYPGCFATLRSVTPKDGDLVLMEIDLPTPLGRSSLDVHVVHTLLGVDWIRASGSMFWRDVSFIVTSHESGSLLALSYDAPKWPMPRAARESLLRKTGHNLVWGLAQCLDTKPRAPATGASP